MSPKTHLEWKQLFIRTLERRCEWERDCGYDEKIGMAAVGSQIAAVERLRPGGTVLHFCAEMMRALFVAYVQCDLDGEYSTGRSSMRPGLDELMSVLPIELRCLREELGYVLSHGALPPVEMVRRNDAILWEASSPDDAS